MWGKLSFFPGPVVAAASAGDAQQRPGPGVDRYPAPNDRPPGT